MKDKNSIPLEFRELLEGVDRGEIVNELLMRVDDHCDSVRRLKRNALRKPLQAVAVVSAADFCICEGGYYHFLMDDRFDDIRQVPSAFRRIGADRVADNLEELYTHFSTKQLKSFDLRSSSIEKPDVTGPWGPSAPLYRAYCDLEEELEEAILAFVREHESDFAILFLE